MSQTLNIVFAGTPVFAVPALERLLASRHRVVAVYTQPDRPAGRGRQVQFSPVKECALGNGVAVEQPVTLRDAEAVRQLGGYSPDLMVVAAYGLLLPPAVLAVPRLGCLNIHASLLPRWRGAAPIHRALLAGDRETGIDIMQMEVGLDTGPVLLERVIAIADRETTGTLHDRLAAVGADAIEAALADLLAGRLDPRPQAVTGVTYANKIRKAEARIDWSRPAVEIDRLVRAFQPLPVAETLYRGQLLKVWEASPVTLHHDAIPGTVLAAANEGIVVATGEKALRLERVQMAGRNPVPVADFLNAHSIAGERLGQ